MAGTLNRDQEAIRGEIHDFGRGSGLSASRLGGSRLLSLVRKPPTWTAVDTARVLEKLIGEAVQQLPDDKERSALGVSLNLADLEVAGLEARQALLANERNCNPETVRRWWNKGAVSLARALSARVHQLNTSNGWEAYREEQGVGPDDDGQPDHRFDYIESTWWFRGRVATELLSLRRLTANKDGLKHYEAHAAYFSDLRPDTCRVVPLLNCELGPTRYTHRNMLLSQLIFPRLLMQDERITFAYKVVVTSHKEATPIFQHECRAAGVDRLVFRLQLDPAARVGRVWRFAVSDDAHAADPPTELDRYLEPSRLGFVEYDFGRARPGWKYGIALEWLD